MAAEKPLYFTGTTEKNPLTYHPGEEIVLLLQLVCEGRPCGCPAIRWTAEGDDGGLAYGRIDGGTGRVTVKTKLTRPGYVRVTVTALDEDGNPLENCTPFEGGAMAEFEKILPLGPEPTDYDAFWERIIREELDPVAPVVLEQQKAESLVPGYHLYQIKIAAPGPDPVSAWLSVPDDPQARLPMHVAMQASSDNITPYTKPTSDGLIILYVNKTGYDNRMSREAYKQALEGPWYHFGARLGQNVDPNGTCFKYMLLRDIQACRFAATLPQWDGKTFRLGGGSFGGFQAVDIAPYVPQLTDLLLGFPWFCDIQGSYYGREMGYVPPLAPALPYYDTCSAAKRLDPRVRVSLDAGLGDHHCPPAGVVAMYNCFRGPKSLHMIQNRVHGYNPPDAPTVHFSSDGLGDALADQPKVEITIH